MNNAEHDVLHGIVLCKRMDVKYGTIRQPADLELHIIGRSSRDEILQCSIKKRTVLGKGNFPNLLNGPSRPFETIENPCTL